MSSLKRFVEVREAGVVETGMYACFTPVCLSTSHPSADTESESRWGKRTHVHSNTYSSSHRSSSSPRYF